MFFLIRSAFWLSIVIMLLPTPDNMKTPESNVGAGQAISAASATMADMKQFCVRQPEACDVGSAALTQFGHKAQASAKWLYDFLTEKLGNNEQTASIKREPKAAPVEVDSSQNTLTSNDTTPAWRGPVRQAEIKR